MSQSRTITVEIEVEIPFRKVVETYGEDADGNRGMRTVEYVPETALVLTGGLPEAVQEWAKVQALTIFEERYN